jgi:bifunctional non-homologous end joining protein LigD
MRKGYDWSGRYPAIAGTAMKLRAESFTLDGEACVCGPDGVAVFDDLHRRGTVREAMLYAFDRWRSTARTFAICRRATARSG